MKWLVRLIPSEHLGIILVLFTFTFMKPKKHRVMPHFRETTLPPELFTGFFHLDGHIIQTRKSIDRFYPL